MVPGFDGDQMSGEPMGGPSGPGTAKNSPISGHVSKKKPADKGGRRPPAFNSEAQPTQRFAERRNYATTYQRPKKFVSMVLPAVMCALVVITSVVLFFRLCSHMIRSQLYEASSGYGVHREARWYFVFRVATGDEVKEGRLVEVNYTNCGQEVIVGCWRPIDQKESPYVLSPEEKRRTYVRNVYSFVQAKPGVICPPSLFIGNYSPIDKNCDSDY